LRSRVVKTWEPPAFRQSALISTTILEVSEIRWSRLWRSVRDSGGIDGSQTQQEGKQYDGTIHGVKCLRESGIAGVPLVFGVEEGYSKIVVGEEAGKEAVGDKYSTSWNLLASIRIFLLGAYRYESYTKA
jgi:hypothetical protein